MFKICKPLRINALAVVGLAAATVRFPIPKLRRHTIPGWEISNEVALAPQAHVSAGNGDAADEQTGSELRWMSLVRRVTSRRDECHRGCPRGVSPLMSTRVAVRVRTEPGGLQTDVSPGATRGEGLTLPLCELFLQGRLIEILWPVPFGRMISPAICLPSSESFPRKFIPSRVLAVIVPLADTTRF